jgi:hypothetical protein
MKKHFIFILPNIYDHISGVSNKYTSFLHYLSTLNQHNSFKITLLHISKNNPNLPNIQLHPTSSIILPLYTSISIPIFTSIHLKNIIEQNYTNIFIFNSEFIWLHPILLHIKKKYNNIQLIPNMHTDIDYYIKEYLKNIPFLSNLIPTFELGNFIDKNLIENKFDKIIVTGNVLYKKYNQICPNKTLNVNEIDLQNFLPFHKPLQLRKDYIWKNGAFINVIYCGRLCVEKNITMVFDICDYLINIYLHKDYSKLNIHIIGAGPYQEDLQNYLKSNYHNLQRRTQFHGSKNHKEIGNFYKNIYNPIFLFCSNSETFGKTGIEALITGIPLFHIESEISKEILVDKKNSFLFKNRSEFVQKFDYYINMKHSELVEMNNYSQQWVKQYDQKVIFQKWFEFINE